MRENKYFEEFGKPFPASDVSWRLQYVNEQRMQGIVLILWKLRKSAVYTFTPYRETT